MPDRAKLIQIEISERTGSVSALAIVPKEAVALLVLAHGAGAGMTHTFMEDVAAELATNGIATLRYNFPYMEKESRRPDPPAVAEKTVSVVVEKACILYPKLPIFAGGKSFGGRMTSQRMAKSCPDYLKGIVFFGFPLHAIGKPSMDRAVHLADVKVPMLFLQGTKDKLADIAMMREVTQKLKDSVLLPFENADHSFKVSKHHIVPDLAREAASWMRNLV